MLGLRAWPVALAVGSWLVVLRGLWFAPASPDPVVDLEGGGSFAAGLDVFLPALALTVLFLVLLVVGAAARLSAPAFVVNVLVVVFSAWTMSRGYLLDYMPSLAIHLWTGNALAAIGAGVAALAWADQHGRVGGSEAHSTPGARNIRS